MSTEVSTSLSVDEKRVRLLRLDRLPLAVNAAWIQNYVQWYFRRLKVFSNKQALFSSWPFHLITLVPGFYRADLP